MAIEGATLVTVLRHGAVQGRPFVYRGRQDDPLSELGWKQMAAVIVASPPFAAIAALLTPASAFVARPISATTELLTAAIVAAMLSM